MRMEPEFYNYAIYISHSPEDTPMAHAMVRTIQSMGLSVWPPPVTKQRGREWTERIVNAIESSEAFLFLVTPNTKFSTWMYFELGAAVGQTMKSLSRRVRPILVGDVPLLSLPPFLRQGQPIWIEAGLSSEEAAERLRYSLEQAGSSAAG